MGCSFHVCVLPTVSSLSCKAVDQRCPSLRGHSRLCGATLRRPFSCGWLPVWPWLLWSVILTSLNKSSPVTVFLYFCGFTMVASQLCDCGYLLVIDACAFQGIGSLFPILC